MDEHNIERAYKETTKTLRRIRSTAKGKNAGQNIIPRTLKLWILDFLTEQNQGWLYKALKYVLTTQKEVKLQLTLMT